MTITAEPKQKPQAYFLPNGNVLRYTLLERVVHWISGVSYVYLLLTGLAFWSPWLFWIAVALGGGTISRMLHPWVGLVFVASVLYMFNMWKQDMWITDKDRQWAKTLGAYVRNEEETEHPVHAARSWAQWAPVDRFNLGQKYLFWIMFWCGIVLLLTGIVLWFPDQIPWSLRFLRYLSVVLHPVAFLVSFGAFIIHVYMSTAVVRGDFTSIVRGEVSQDWAKYHHRLWFDRISGNAPARK